MPYVFRSVAPSHRSILRVACRCACTLLICRGTIASAADDARPETPPAIAADAAPLDADDELWFVSSRRAQHAPDGSVRLDVWRYDGAGHWHASSLDELAAADGPLPTCFHVHGNRVDWSQANCGGWRYFTCMTDGCRRRPPLRFIIFSWPSERLCCGNQRDDVRAKAVAAECHAYYLAKVVERLPAEAQIGMIGYSYGARVIGGALHLLGGGCLRGNALPSTSEVTPRSVRAVFLAAALDDDHFLPGRCFACAPSQIDRLLVAVNGCDRALKWYPLLYELRLRPRTGQQAMGYAGLVGLNCVPQLCGRVEHCNVACQVGKQHEWHGFAHLCGSFVERMRQYVYFEPLDDAACERCAADE